MNNLLLKELVSQESGGSSFILAVLKLKRRKTTENDHR